MKEYLKKLPDEILSLIYLAEEISAKRHCKAYLIGGFVRDLILGVNNFDLDIAVEGEGIAFAQELARKLGVKVITHHRFGTATVMFKHHLKIDIATTRREFYPEPGSLPVVSFGSLKDDLGRRDFTINALAMGISGEEFGKLIDMFSGSVDLRNKRVRILHALSFIDDPTRILRAVRFEKRYDFAIEENTLARLKEAVKLTMLEKVQPQRLRDEIILMLKEKTPFVSLSRLKELAGLKFINKKLKLSRESSRLFSTIGQEIGWYISEHNHRRHLDIWLIYLMALLDSLSVKEVKAVCKKFVFRKGEEKRILSCKMLYPRIVLKLGRAFVKPSEIFEALEPLSYEVILFMRAKYKNKNIRRHINDFLALHSGMSLAISGHDLAALGIEPGPCYQGILYKVLNAKLDGKIKTREDELELVKKLIKHKKG